MKKHDEDEDELFAIAGKGFEEERKVIMMVSEWPEKKESEREIHTVRVTVT